MYPPSPPPLWGVGGADTMLKSTLACMIVRINGNLGMAPKGLEPRLSQGMWKMWKSILACIKMGMRRSLKGSGFVRRPVGKRVGIHFSLQNCRSSDGVGDFCAWGVAMGQPPYSPPTQIPPKGAPMAIPGPPKAGQGNGNNVKINFSLDIHKD